LTLRLCDPLLSLDSVLNLHGVDSHHWRYRLTALSVGNKRKGSIRAACRSAVEDQFDRDQPAELSELAIMGGGGPFSDSGAAVAPIKFPRLATAEVGGGGGMTRNR
jgi:hypothetical protein